MYAMVLVLDEMLRAEVDGIGMLQDRQEGITKNILKHLVETKIWKGAECTCMHCLGNLKKILHFGPSKIMQLFERKRGV